MKKSILFLFCCIALSFSCFSQDCEIMYQSAMQYFEKEDYVNARSRFAQVVDDCGKGGDYRGALGKIKECDEKIAEQSQQSLKVYPYKLNFGAQGGTGSVKVTSNSSWMYGNCPSWIKLTKTSQTKLTVDCDFNDSGYERKAEIMIKNEDDVRKKIRIIQECSQLRVDKALVELPGNSEASSQITVDCTEDWYVEGQNAVWFSLKKNTKGIMVSSKENPSTSVREGAFVIKTSNGATQQITVKQTGSDPWLEVPSSVSVGWNEVKHIIVVNSNVKDWSVKVTKGDWCSVAKLNDDEVVLNTTENNLDSSRTAELQITAGNIKRTVIVTQRVFGYVALYEDYFKNIGGTKKVTKASVGVYALGGYGVRASAFMYRWKVVEFDLVNLNMGYSKSFNLSWEPMIRGYLPLQRDGRFWAAYMGFGRRVPIYEGYPKNPSKIVFEMGAEGQLLKRDDISTRLFFRIDGAFSLGVAFDLHEWK